MRKLSTEFWPQVFCDWFEAYPEKAVWFPDYNTLTEKQEDLLKSKLDERRRVSFVLCIIMHGEQE